MRTWLQRLFDGSRPDKPGIVPTTRPSRLFAATYSEDADLTLTLNRSEALVLFEWLTKREEQLEKQETPGIPVVPDAERLVMWSLECQLQTKLWELFAPNYEELHRQARDTVVKDNGY